MVYSNRGLKLIIFFTLLTVLTTGAVGVKPDISIAQNDQVIWKNDGVLDSTVNFTATCNGTAVSQQDTFVWDGRQQYSVQGNSDGFWINTSARQLDIGTYQIVAECSGDQSTKEFQIDTLSLNIEEVSNNAEIFLGKTFDTDIFIESELGNLGLENLGYPELFLKEDGESYSKVGELKVKDQRMTIKSSTIPVDFISSDSESGKVSVKVDYNQRTSNDLNYVFTLEDDLDVDLKRWAIKFNAIPERRISQEQLSDLNISLDMMYEGEPVTPPSEDMDFAGNFYLERGEPKQNGEYEWFSGGFRKVSDDGGYGEYMLSLEKMPRLDVGDHSLDVYFETGEYGPKKVGTVYVEKKFTFEGRVSNADSRAVNTDFNLESGDIIENFETNSRGQFSRRVVPGTYGFDLSFPEGSLVLSGVELDESYSGNINYNYYKDPGELDLEGIKPINMMSVSFGYPFDSGRARMQYNPAKTDNPADADVFECVEWNFWAEECISGWDKISSEDVQIRPTDWTARFPVTPVKTDEYDGEKKVLYSAYVVGTNSKLEVSRIGLDDYRIASEDSFKATGTVVTNTGPVDDADVTFQLRDGSRTVAEGTGVTGSDGEFNFDVEAPEDAGNFTMYVKTEKGSFVDYEEEIDEEVWIYKKKELSMDIPEQLEIVPGNSTEAELTIENNGQVDFENIRLGVDGPSKADYSLSKTSFDVIEAGDSETFYLNIDLPADYCSPSCSKYPVFEIDLTAGEGANRFEKTFEVQTDLSRRSLDSNNEQQNTQTEQTTDNTNNGGSLATGNFAEMLNTDFGSTGKFLQTQTGVNLALGLITIFTLALAGAVKKKKTGSQPQTRRALTPSQHPSIQKPQVSAPHTLSPSDEIDEIAEAMDGHVVDVDEVQDEAEDEVDEESWFSKLEEEENAEMDESPEAEVVDEEEVEIESAASEEAPKEMNEEGVGDADEEDVEPEVEESESQIEKGAHKCDICGEAFDTPAGLKLHKQALH